MKMKIIIGSIIIFLVFYFFLAQFVLKPSTTERKFVLKPSTTESKFVLKPSTTESKLIDEEPKKPWISRSLNNFLMKFAPPQLRSLVIFDDSETLVFYLRAGSKEKEKWSPFFGFFDIPVEYVEWAYGTSNDGYVIQMLQRKEDWVINIDQDAFISNITSILELLIIMKLKGSDYSCFPDGGQEVREHNPVSCNPFFNILNLKPIRNKIDPFSSNFIHGFQATNEIKEKFIKKFGSWDPYSLETIPERRIPEGYRSDCVNNYLWDDCEPYHKLFIYLYYHLEVEWLAARAITISKTSETSQWDNAHPYCPNDHPTLDPNKLWIGTSLINQYGQPYILHSWYARDGEGPRIRYLKEQALLQMQQVTNERENWV